MVLSLLMSGVIGSARADDAPTWEGSSLFPQDFTIAPSATYAPAPQPRPNRIQMFRMTPAFKSDPISLDPDDQQADDSASDPDPLPGVQIAFGSDNPFLDVRRRGDPGGVGFYRLQSQVQVVDSDSTGFAVGFKAVTPAGRESNGVDNGPTYVSPSLSYFQSLDENLALQAFVGKRMRLDLHSQGAVSNATEYGVGLNSPLTDGAGGQGRVYAFVEATGRYRYADTTSDRPTVWEMTPGLHWQMNENWWMSGGLIIPVDRPDLGQWQISCWMKF